MPHPLVSRDRVAGLRDLFQKQDAELDEKLGVKPKDSKK